MGTARFVVFECFLDRGLFALQSRNEVAQVRDAVTAPATAQTGARDGRVDELAHYPN
jgi:hypothetical protein